MFRELRRKKQALPDSECLSILEKQKNGVLAVLGDHGYPYTVPLNYLYYNSKIYFHCAKNGHKIDAIKNHDKISFCVIDKDEVVPDRYTTYFRSIVVFGRIKIITDTDYTNEIIKKLAYKYSPYSTEQNINDEILTYWKNLLILELSIEHIKGKQAIELVNGER